MEDMSLQLDVYEESSEHESDGENSGPENGSDRENLVKESWFLSPKRKWTLDEEVSEEPHGKRIRKKSLKAREMKNFEKAFESSEIDSDVLSEEEELPLNEPVADNMSSEDMSSRPLRKRCNKCVNCLKPDCRKCTNCLDMKKYGGPGRMKQSCEERLCTEYWGPGKKRKPTEKITPKKLKSHQDPEISEEDFSSEDSADHDTESTEDEDVTWKQRQKPPQKRCNKCENCLKPNCRKCTFCLDMKKYGGPARLKQSCEERWCKLLLESGKKKIPLKKRGKYCVRRRRAPRQLKHVKTVEKDWLSEMDSPVVEKERSPEIDSSSVVEKDRLREMDSSAEAGKDRVSQKVSASIDSLIKHNEQKKQKSCKGPEMSEEDSSSKGSSMEHDLELDVYEESSEHESDRGNSVERHGSARENSAKESWFLSRKRKSLDEEVSVEPHGKRIRKKTLKAREMKNFEKAFEGSEIDSDVLLEEEEWSSKEPVADNMSSEEGMTSRPLRRRCNKCVNCLKPDCRKCINCLDMKKYGGPGRMKQSCEERLCTEYWGPGKKRKPNEEIPQKKQKSPEDPEMSEEDSFSEDSSTEHDLEFSDDENVTWKQRQRRCNKCENCRKPNCRKCDHCLDMKKYGGPGRMKQSCKERWCKLLLESGKKKIPLKKRGKYRKAPKISDTVGTVEKNRLSEMDSSSVVEKDRLPETDSATKAGKDRMPDIDSVSKTGKARLLEMDSAPEAGKDRLLEMDSAPEAEKDKVSEKVSSSIDSSIELNEQMIDEEWWQSTDEAEKAVWNRRSRCHKCDACLRQDCRKCNYCLDMPRYGGSGKLRQGCSWRQCTNLKKNTTKAPEKPLRKAYNLENILSEYMAKIKRATEQSQNMKKDPAERKAKFKKDIAKLRKKLSTSWNKHKNLKGDAAAGLKKNKTVKDVNRDIDGDQSKHKAAKDMNNDMEANQSKHEAAKDMNTEMDTDQDKHKAAKNMNSNKDTDQSKHEAGENMNSNKDTDQSKHKAAENMNSNKETDQREHKAAENMNSNKDTDQSKHKAAENMNSNKDTNQSKHEAAENMNSYKDTDQSKHKAAENMNSNKDTDQCKHEAAENMNSYKDTDQSKHEAAENMNSNKDTDQSKHKAVENMNSNKETDQSKHKAVENMNSNKETDQSKHKAAEIMNSNKETDQSKHEAAKDMNSNMESDLNEQSVVKDVSNRLVADQNEHEAASLVKGNTTTDENEHEAASLVKGNTTTDQNEPNDAKNLNSDLTADQNEHEWIKNVNSDLTADQNGHESIKNVNTDFTGDQNEHEWIKNVNSDLTADQNGHESIKNVNSDLAGDQNGHESAMNMNNDLTTDQIEGECANKMNSDLTADQIGHEYAKNVNNDLTADQIGHEYAKNVNNDLTADQIEHEYAKNVNNHLTADQIEHEYAKNVNNDLAADQSEHEYAKNVNNDLTADQNGHESNSIKNVNSDLAGDQNGHESIKNVKSDLAEDQSEHESAINMNNDLTADQSKEEYANKMNSDLTADQTEHEEAWEVKGYIDTVRRKPKLADKFMMASTKKQKHKKRVKPKKSYTRRSPTEDVQSTKQGRRKRSHQSRCKKCDNCLNRDCGECGFCLDMPKYGGKGLWKRCCIMRQCLNLDEQTRPKSQEACESETEDFDQAVPESVVIEIDISEMDTDRLSGGDSDSQMASPEHDKSYTIVRWSPTQDVQSTTQAGMKKTRCKQCDGCLTPNCLECRFCLDMPKYGGKGLWKRCCIMRKCINLDSAHFSSRPRCIDVRKIRKERTDVGKLRKNRADVEKVRKNRADVERIRRRNVEGIRKRKAAAETIRKKRAEQVIEEVARSSDSNNQEIIKILTSDLQSSVTEKDQSTKPFSQHDDTRRPLMVNKEHHKTMEKDTTTDSLKNVQQSNTWAIDDHQNSGTEKEELPPNQLCESQKEREIVRQQKEKELKEKRLQKEKEWKWKRLQKEREKEERKKERLEKKKRKNEEKAEKEEQRQEEKRKEKRKRCSSKRIKIKESLKRSVKESIQRRKECPSLCVQDDVHSRENFKNMCNLRNTDVHRGKESLCVRMVNQSVQVDMPRKNIRKGGDSVRADIHIFQNSELRSPRYEGQLKSLLPLSPQDKRNALVIKQEPLEQEVQVSMDSQDRLVELVIKQEPLEQEVQVSSDSQDRLVELVIKQEPLEQEVQVSSDSQDRLVELVIKQEAVEQEANISTDSQDKLVELVIKHEEPLEEQPQLNTDSQDRLDALVHKQKPSEQVELRSGLQERLDTLVIKQEPILNTGSFDSPDNFTSLISQETFPQLVRSLDSEVTTEGSLGHLDSLFSEESLVKQIKVNTKKSRSISSSLVSQGTSLEPVQMNTRDSHDQSNSLITQGTSLQPVQMNTDDSSNQSNYLITQGTSLQPVQMNTGDSHDQSNSLITQGTSLQPVQMNTSDSHDQSNSLITQGTSLQPVQMNTGDSHDQSNSLITQGTSLQPVQMNTGDSHDQSNSLITQGTSLQPVQMNTGDSHDQSNSLITQENYPHLLDSSVGLLASNVNISTVESSNMMSRINTQVSKELHVESIQENYPHLDASKQTEDSNIHFSLINTQVTNGEQDVISFKESYHDELYHPRPHEPYPVFLFKAGTDNNFSLEKYYDHLNKSGFDAGSLRKCEKSSNGCESSEKTLSGRTSQTNPFKERSVGEVNGLEVVIETNSKTEGEEDGIIDKGYSHTDVGTEPLLPGESSGHMPDQLPLKPTAALNVSSDLFLDRDKPMMPPPEPIIQSKIDPCLWVVKDPKVSVEGKALIIGARREKEPTLIFIKDRQVIAGSSSIMDIKHGSLDTRYEIISDKPQNKLVLTLQHPAPIIKGRMDIFTLEEACDLMRQTDHSLCCTVAPKEPKGGDVYLYKPPTKSKKDQDKWKEDGYRWKAFHIVPFIRKSQTLVMSPAALMLQKTVMFAVDAKGKIIPSIEKHIFYANKQSDGLVLIHYKGGFDRESAVAVSGKLSCTSCSNIGATTGTGLAKSEITPGTLQQQEILINTEGGHKSSTITVSKGTISEQLLSSVLATSKIPSSPGPSPRKRVKLEEKPAANKEIVAARKDLLDEPRKKVKLEEKPAANEEIAAARKLILDERYVQMRGIKENYTEHLTECFYLQSGQNLMDFRSWKKRPTPQLVQFLKSGRLDSDDDEENPLIYLQEKDVRKEVKVLTSGSSIPLATQSVAASTTLSTSATALSNQDAQIPTVVPSVIEATVSKSREKGTKLTSIIPKNRLDDSIVSKPYIVDSWNPVIIPYELEATDAKSMGEDQTLTSIIPTCLRYPVDMHSNCTYAKPLKIYSSARALRYPEDIHNYCKPFNHSLPLSTCEMMSFRSEKSSSNYYSFLTSSGNHGKPGKSQKSSMHGKIMEFEKT